jgi:hypothetical protein
MSFAETRGMHAQATACMGEHRAYWVVIQRECNHSAFNGYHRAPSDYSGLKCWAPGCGRAWRTKAAYVRELPDVFWSDEFGGRPGYVAGTCGHAMAFSEWRAGFRNCERCPLGPTLPWMTPRR